MREMSTAPTGCSPSRRPQSARAVSSMRVGTPQPPTSRVRPQSACAAATYRGPGLELVGTGMDVGGESESESESERESERESEGESEGEVQRVASGRERLRPRSRALGRNPTLTDDQAHSDSSGTVSSQTSSTSTDAPAVRAQASSASSQASAQTDSDEDASPQTDSEEEGEAETYTDESAVADQIGMRQRIALGKSAGCVVADIFSCALAGQGCGGGSHVAPHAG